VFGLDLDDLSVKVVEIDRGGNSDRVRSYGTNVIPAGSIVDGAVMKPDVVAQAVRDAMRAAKPKPIRTSKAYCSLPENKAFVRIVDMPAMKDEEVREAIKWQIEENIPLGIDQVYYNWKALPRSFSQEKGFRSILLVAVARSAVDSTLEAMRLAGLEVVGMEVESIAQANSLIAQTVSDTTLIVDIADRRTSLLFTVEGIPCFTSGLPVSAQMFTESIARGLNISNTEAEALKIQKGIGSMVKNDPLFETVKPVLENLASNIQSTMDFYADSLKYSGGVDTILLCGGGGRLKGLTLYLSRRLGKVVRPGNPWVNFRFGCDLPPIAKEESVRFSTAIGLALCARSQIYEDIA
jgi:type IV pilus assembly protein PilM